MFILPSTLISHNYSTKVANCTVHNNDLDRYAYLPELKEDLMVCFTSFLQCEYDPRLSTSWNGLGSEGFKNSALA